MYVGNIHVSVVVLGFCRENMTMSGNIDASCIMLFVFLLVCFVFFSPPWITRSSILSKFALLCSQAMLTRPSPTSPTNVLVTDMPSTYPIVSFAD